LVLIRLPDSPGLNGVLLADEEAEERPEDVRSKPFTVTFPLGPDGKREALKVEVKLTSPDFTPPEQAKNLFVPPDGNSEVISFILTPIRTGQLRVLVELQWEDALRGSRRLLTECLAEAASLPAGAEMHVVRIPLGMSSEAVEVTGATRVFDDGPREFISMQSGSQIHKHIDLLRDGLEAPAQALKSKISRPGQTGNAEEPAPPPAPSQGETGAILRETVLRELSAKIEREPKRGGPRAGYPPMPESKPMAPRLETGETREGGVALEIRNHLSSARRKPTVVVAVIWAVALALAALAVIYLSMRNH